MSKPTIGEIIQDIKNVAYKHRRNGAILKREYLEKGKYNKEILENCGMTFVALKVEAGLTEKSRIETRKVKMETKVFPCNECGKKMKSPLDKYGRRLMYRCNSCKANVDQSVYGSNFCDA